MLKKIFKGLLYILVIVIAILLPLFSDRHPIITDIYNFISKVNKDYYEVVLSALAIFATFLIFNSQNEKERNIRYEDEKKRNEREEKEYQENRENGNFIPSIEQRDVIITNQITYEYTCSKGHPCFCVLQIERFEMLYKLAIHEFLENNFRACVINCAAALERFYEFFLKVVFHHNGYSSEKFYEEIWLSIKDRRHRQEALSTDTL